MTSSLDPPRFASGRADVPAALSDALRSAANDGPTPHELERLSASVAPFFLMPPSAVPVTGGFSHSSTSILGRMLGSGVGRGATMLAVATVCAVGGYGAWRSLRPVPASPQNIPAAAVVQADVPLPAPAKDPISAGKAPFGSVRAEPVAGGAAPPAVKMREPPHARPAELPAAPSLGETTIAPPPPKPELSEWALVDSARRSMATEPRRALALVQEHHRRFAGGPLSEEADFIEIEAMKRLGRLDEVRALEDRFHSRYPSSIHGQTIQMRPTPTP